MKLFNKTATVPSRTPLIESLEGRQFMSASTMSFTATPTSSSSSQVTADTTPPTRTTTIGDLHIVILISKSSPKL